MSESIVLEVTDHHRSELEKRAHQRGFETVQQYLLALAEADWEVDEDEISPIERFREGWREVLAGNEGITYDEIWEE